ncbi:MAG TPA: hypothetical protein VLM91_19270 [Candidatus Methylomirabilis sp.]|nr:hypothetical protein [Candidatus Methylomirabilis sp.]
MIGLPGDVVEERGGRAGVDIHTVMGRAIRMGCPRGKHWWDLRSDRIGQRLP